MNNQVKILGALADETRLRMYLLLAKNELCVCELMMILHMEQSRISHCLRVLKEAGLVDSRREGKWVVYFENPEVANSSFLQALKKETQLSSEYANKLTSCRNGQVRTAGISKTLRKAMA